MWGGSHRVGHEVVGQLICVHRGNILRELALGLVDGDGAGGVGESAHLGYIKRRGGGGSCVSSKATARKGRSVRSGQMFRRLNGGVSPGILSRGGGGKRVVLRRAGRAALIARPGGRDVEAWLIVMRLGPAMVGEGWVEFRFEVLVARSDPREYLTSLMFLRGDIRCGRTSVYRFG